MSQTSELNCLLCSMRANKLRTRNLPSKSYTSFKIISLNKWPYKSLEYINLKPQCLKSRVSSYTFIHFPWSYILIQILAISYFAHNCPLNSLLASCTVLPESFLYTAARTVFYFFKSGLLRFDLYIIKCLFKKCTVLWVVTNACKHITTIIQYLDCFQFLPVNLCIQCLV